VLREKVGENRYDFNRLLLVFRCSLMQSTLLFFTDFVGIVAFALAGILAAEGKKVDPVGVFVMAFTTAFGGGILRDLIIDNRPMYWIANEEYIWVTLLMALFAPSIIHRFKAKSLHTLFIWSDAVGLGFFSAGGTSLALSAGVPPLPSAMLGVCTGVFGGMLRDVFLNQIPMVLSDEQPYASSAFAGAWLYILMNTLDVPEFWALLGATAFIVAVRMTCWYNGWNIITYGRRAMEKLRQGRR